MAQKARVTVLRSGRAGFWLSSEKYSSAATPFFQEPGIKDIVKFSLMHDTTAIQLLNDTSKHYAYDCEFAGDFKKAYFDIYWQFFGITYLNFEEEFPELNALSEATGVATESELMSIQLLKSNSWAIVDVKIIKETCFSDCEIPFFLYVSKTFLEL